MNKFHQFEKNYMPKTINYSCVKSVKNNWINNSINSVLLSTNTFFQLHIAIKSVCNHLLIQQTLPLLSTDFSTCNYYGFNLLNKSFTHNPQYLLLELLKKKKER